MTTLNQIKNNPHIEVIQPDNIDENLNNLEQKIGIEIRNKTFLKDALNMVREASEQIEGYNLYIAVDWTNNNVYIVGEREGTQVQAILNTFINSGNLNELNKRLNSVKDVLTAKGTLQLRGDRYSREITSADGLMGFFKEDTLVKKSTAEGTKLWNERWWDTEFWEERNNLVEEIYLFAITLRGQEPKGDDSIFEDSGPIGNNEDRPTLSIEE